MSTIQLGSEVRVSDPCYTDDVWCKTQLKNVLPGEYNVEVEFSDQGDWGNRVSGLTVVHKDHINKMQQWDFIGTIGVDSGQAGVFCETSYRNDDIVVKTPESDFTLPYNDNAGDKWYENMCKLTLSEHSYGSYETGVVTSTGFGDGSYPLEVSKDADGKIVAVRIVYISNEEEDEGDVCGVCGEEIEYGETCDCIDE